MIRLETFGTIQLLNEDGAEVRSVLAQPKRVALLVYLAAAEPRGYQRRDTLLGLFWPESDMDHARGALNQAIYQLRQSLGTEAIQSRGKEELGLDPDLVWCDVPAFEDLAASGEFSQALDLYRGDFLAGFHLSDAADWERWLDNRRRRLKTAAAAAAWSLAEEALEDRPMDAARWGHRAMSLASGDEVSLRRLMELLERTGDRAGAVAVYEETADRLSREYGVEPSPETRSLLARLRSYEPGPEEGAASPGGGPPATSEPSEPQAAAAEPRGSSRRWLALPRSAVVPGLFLFLLLAATVIWWRGGFPSAPSATDLSSRRVRLAVLPLENLSNDSAHAFFTDGLHEELISTLARMEGLRVIARTSVQPFRKSERGLGEIAATLNVQAILEGSVRWSGDSLRVTLQLIDAASEEHLWLNDYDVEFSDLLAVQREIASEVARALKLQVGPPEPARTAGTEDPDAYRAYLTGRYYLGRLDRESFIEARNHFVRALDEDPNYAAAWGGLAEAYGNLTSLAVLPAGQAYPVAREAAEKALDLDPSLAEAHAVLASVFDRYYWDSDTAEMHFEHSLELDPSSARARRLYAAYLRNEGRFAEALAEIRAAQELDPLFAFSRLEEGSILYMAGRYDEAIEKYQELIRLVPGMDRAFVFIGLARAQQERFEEALDAVSRMDPEVRHPDAIAIKGYVYGRMGRNDEARRMLDLLEGLPGEQAVSPFQEAVIWVALGEQDRALQLLERAVDAPTWHMRLLKVEPSFAPLRSHPRFQELLRRVDLAD